MSEPGGALVRTIRFIDTISDWSGRIADLDRAVAILKRKDVPFLSEVAPCCSGTGEDTTGIVHAIDPDGVYLELVGRIAKQPLQPQPKGCPELKIKLPAGS